MLQKNIIALAFFGQIFAVIPAFAQVSPSAASVSYADMADLSADTPLAIQAQIRKAVTVKPERAPGLAQNHQRFYVEARDLGKERHRQGHQLCY